MLPDDRAFNIGLWKARLSSGRKEWFGGEQAASPNLPADRYFQSRTNRVRWRLGCFGNAKAAAGAAPNVVPGVAAALASAGAGGYVFCF